MIVAATRSSGVSGVVGLAEAGGLVVLLLLVCAVMLPQQAVHAQSETASHTVTITVEESVRLDLEDGPTLTVEQGETATAETSYAVHSNHQASHSIRASIEDAGDLPDGITVSAAMEAPGQSEEASESEPLALAEGEEVTLVEDLSRANATGLTLTYEADIDPTVAPEQFEVEITYTIAED